MNWECITSGGGFFNQVLSFYIKMNLVSHYEINTMKNQWTDILKIKYIQLREVEA